MIKTKSKILSQRKLLRALLKQLRINAQLTQAGLAGKLKQPQSFVSKYESGERRLDILELRSICAVLKISLADFVKALEDKLNETV
jgi:transcriptional regulator with XRE-family HTH domain